MKPDVFSFELSKHAKRRVAQRSIHEKSLALVLTFGVSRPLINGCKILRLNKSSAKELIAEKVNVEVVRRAQKIAAIVSSAGVVVTSYFCTDQAIRKYKRAA